MDRRTHTQTHGCLHTDTWTNGYMDGKTQTDRLRKRQIRQAHRRRDMHMDRQTGILTDGCTHRWMDTLRDPQIVSQTHRSTPQTHKQDPHNTEPPTKAESPKHIDRTPKHTDGTQTHR